MFSLSLSNTHESCDHCIIKKKRKGFVTLTYSTHSQAIEIKENTGLSPEKTWPWPRPWASSLRKGNENDMGNALWPEPWPYPRIASLSIELQQITSLVRRNPIKTHRFLWFQVYHAPSNNKIEPFPGLTIDYDLLMPTNPHRKRHQFMEIGHANQHSGPWRRKNQNFWAKMQGTGRWLLLFFIGWWS